MSDAKTGLHAAIMNLPCKVPPMVVDDHAYKLGHRDARHAAAELADQPPSVPPANSEFIDAAVVMARCAGMWADAPLNVKCALDDLRRAIDKHCQAATPSAPSSSQQVEAE